MGEKIEAGFFADANNLIKTLSKTLFKFLDKLVDIGVEVSKPEQTEEGGSLVTMIINGEKAEITTTPVEDKQGYVDVIITRKDGKKIERKSIPENNVENEIIAALEELKFDVALLKEKAGIKSNKKLQVKLHKVEANNKVNIELTAINANYSIEEAMTDLNAVLLDDNFVDTLSDTPQSFEIADTGEEYDVNTTSEFNANSTITHILSAAMLLWCNLKTLHWNAAGNSFFRLHEQLDIYTDELLRQIDILGEISVELICEVPNPGALIDIGACIEPGRIEMKEGFVVTRHQIDQYVDILNAWYVNFSHDIQSTLDEFIRYWTQESQYKLASILGDF